MRRRKTGSIPRRCQRGAAIAGRRTGGGRRAVGTSLTADAAVHQNLLVEIGVVAVVEVVVSGYSAVVVAEYRNAVVVVVIAVLLIFVANGGSSVADTVFAGAGPRFCGSVVVVGVQFSSLPDTFGC